MIIIIKKTDMESVPYLSESAIKSYIYNLTRK